MSGFFRNAVDSFKQTFKNHFSPQTYVDIFSQAPNDIIDTVKSIGDVSIKEHPFDFLKNLGGAAFSLYFPVSDLLNAYNPDREDLKYAGPFQNTATRLFDTATALSWAMGDRNPLWRGSGWGALPAQLGAGLIIRGGLGYLGGMADKLTGNDVPIPQIEQPQDPFSRSVDMEQDRIMKQDPYKSTNRAKRLAIYNTLSAANDFLQNVNINM